MQTKTILQDLKFMLPKSWMALFSVLLFVFGLPSYSTAQEFSQVPEVAPSKAKSIEPEKVQTKKTQPKKVVDYKLGPQANWIWGPKANQKNYFFQKSFSGKGIRKAHLIATCDNVINSLSVNKQKVLTSSEWSQPVAKEITKFLVEGENSIVVDTSNEGSVAGLAIKLVLENAQGKLTYLTTDKSWTASETADAMTEPVKIVGKMGDGPWGNVFAKDVGGPVAERDIFNLLPGFQVELIYSVPKNTLGSWVSLCVDNKGRIIASDQGNKGLCRITPAPLGSKGETKVERLKIAKITSAQGMLYAFDSLYVSINGGPGSGLYRCRDTNGDDQFDEVKKLKALQGGGEHGPHALRLSPDGKSIYMIAGNHTNPPKDFQESRIPKNWDEDLLLPRQWDARGHARGKLAPGGWIAKTDPDGKSWEMFSVGYRNPYDMDFNADGELFAYDADMEWDMGSPWYRPTRVVHATSGSEFGWRSGTGKWPTYYVDSLPQLVDIGPGSPVGAEFGYGAKFPAKYQKALFICDWTFGTMYAIHITPSGASYTATKEEFVSRTPLPLTDVAIGGDGAMYFTIGGRGAQSALYRVTYVGDKSTEPATLNDEQFADLRSKRRELEKLHFKNADAAVDSIWNSLGHADRHIRYAARVALERQSIDSVLAKLEKEQDAVTVIQAAVAIARQGKKEHQSLLMSKLDAIDFSALNQAQRLELLRTWQLVFIRLGKPDAKVAMDISNSLDPFYPAKTDSLNRELVNLLVYLNSSKVVAKTLKMMENPAQQSLEDRGELLKRNAGYGGTIAKMLSNLPEIQNIHYAFALRNMRYGWTLDERKRYFSWLNSALSRSGGASYQGFIKNIRTEAMANLSDAEKVALKSTAIAPPIKATDLPEPIGPGKAWETDELLTTLKNGLVDRNFEKGKRTFAASKCIVCHRFDGNGGSTGPDLTSVAGRFSQKDLIEAITEPNKVISDQYRAHNIETVDGLALSGRILSEDGGKLTLATDPEDGTKVVEIKLDDIEEKAPSKTSLMPAELLNTLNRDEVLDLIAYLLSRGNPDDPIFQEK